MKKQQILSCIMLMGVALFVLTGCDTEGNDAPVINANAMDANASDTSAYSSSDQTNDQDTNTVVVPTSDIQVVPKSTQEQPTQSQSNEEVNHEKKAHHHRVHHAKTQRSGWIWPAQGELSLKFSADHPGIDIQGEVGEPVVAVNSGTVIYSQNNVNRYGNMIIIDHGNHLMTSYAYNQTLLVQLGDQVTAGQKIATMGENPDGKARVYFEVRHNGKPADPFGYLSKTP